MGHTGRDHEWLDYYNNFDYLSPDSVRDGSHPQVFEHDEPADKAIILIHGLTDSPHFMRAIAEFFFSRLGYDVYLPLLRGHGLKQPGGMTKVRLKDWKANIAFALQKASTRTNHISIGGLSAGGALSFYTAATDPRVSGSVYLFSAALDIAGGIGGLWGEVAERLLRTPVARVLERLEQSKPLINANPFRYARMDKGGAIQLGRLIKDTDRLMAGYDQQEAPFPKRIFAAHSEGDHAAHIDGIKALFDIAEPEKCTLFTIPKAVKHASVVLKEPIYAADSSPEDPPLEEANPMFDEMMDALATFERGEQFA